MVQIPIVAGIYADVTPDFRASYPVNLVPVPKTQGISEGFLKPADGVVANGTGPGATRGGIVWNGICYRVMGSKLVAVARNGRVRVIGDVGGSGIVSMTYSFDHLAIASGGKLWLYDGTTLAQNTDADLGAVVDVDWLAGYFITTDGTSIVVTELGDPFSVSPLKYGSSERDPDAILSVVSLRNEIYAMNRNTIEVFSNVGGSGFPFQVIGGAQIHRGVIGTHAATVFMETIAFVGSARNEPPAIWMAASGTSTKISTREIDQRLKSYSEGQLSKTLVEVGIHENSTTLMVHLPDETLCFDAAASQAAGVPVWYVLRSRGGAYTPRHLVWAYDAALVGRADGNDVGVMDRGTFNQWGEVVEWTFSTPVMYNSGKRAQVHELELVCLTGGAAVGTEPQVYAEYSNDGVTWSQPKGVKVGRSGDRNHRIRWLRQGTINNWRIYRFSGDSNAPLSVARLEAQVEPLAW